MPLPCAVIVRVKPVAVMRWEDVVMEELLTVSVTDATLIVMVVARLVLVLVTVEGLLPLAVPKEAMVTPPSTLRVSVDELRVT